MSGKVKALIVTGCLAQRYREEILKEIPEVDAVLGTASYDDILEAVEKTLKGKSIFPSARQTGWWIPAADGSSPPAGLMSI